MRQASPSGAWLGVLRDDRVHGWDSIHYLNFYSLLTLRVHVPDYHILGPQSPFIGSTLRPNNEVRGTLG